MPDIMMSDTESLVLVRHQGLRNWSSNLHATVFRRRHTRRDLVALAHCPRCSKAEGRLWKAQETGALVQQLNMQTSLALHRPLVRISHARPIKSPIQGAHGSAQRDRALRQLAATPESRYNNRPRQQGRVVLRMLMLKPVLPAQVKARPSWMLSSKAGHLPRR